MLPLRPAVKAMKPYVPGKPVEDVYRELGITDLCKLNQNENPLGPSPAALAAVTGAVARIHTYPEGTSRALRERLAALWGLPASWFIVGNGSDEVFRLLAETYLQEGDQVVVPSPSYASYPMVAELMGAGVVRVPLVNHGMDLPGMARAARENHAKIIFLCRPNNPTGTVFAEQAIREFMPTVPAGTVVLLDEAYREWDTTPFETAGLVRDFPNLIVTRTFSKIYGLAGFRLGYGVARPDFLAPFYTVRDPFSVNTLAAAAGLAALDDHPFLERSRQNNEAGKRFLYAAFDRLGIAYIPTESNFILFDVRRPATEVFDAMLRRGVLLRPCGSFGLPTSMRVTIGTPAENQRFIEALTAVLKP